ncbi:CHAD domain-containing protein [Lyngbya confervoides]|uniref:CHAD domain-containing protein n=1 Tax=Lyngbya confervoides BDU141951 TaxID=1574623 RepID=A0ABD4T5S2_9CYAN|nr:CHAD domain-containing protein [Lyngbya confervoides]MCM1983986.1 CHAD domain-containing protein [Lyngbya confervoides BDU141951]
MLESSPSIDRQSSAALASVSDLDLEHPVGQFAKQIIQLQFQRILQHETGVLEDRDPEQLHQMRVAFRRLRTALEIFQGVVRFPKGASIANIRTLSKSLGTLRDLDVQLEALQTDYVNAMAQPHSQTLQHLQRQLEKKRRKAFKRVKKLLKSQLYRKFCQGCAIWLEDPVYTSLGQVPLAQILPELLLPLVAQFVIHPAWQLAKAEINPETSPRVHDLRKRCKHVRYQSEFFVDCYGKAFKKWIKTLKTLQDHLGQLQDSYVFLAMVQDRGTPASDPTAMEDLAAEQRLRALSDWEDQRQNYLDRSFRRQLYEMILAPKGTRPDLASGEENIPAPAP